MTTKPTTTTTPRESMIIEDEDDDGGGYYYYGTLVTAEILKRPDEITNHNTVGMCCEETCDKDEAHFMVIKLLGMKLHVVLCDKHAEKIDGAVFELVRQKVRRRKEEDLRIRGGGEGAQRAT